MAGVGIGHCREAIARRIQHPRRAGVASRVVVNPAGAPPRKRGRSCQPPPRGAVVAGSARVRVPPGRGRRANGPGLAVGPRHRVTHDGRTRRPGTDSPRPRPRPSGSSRRGSAPAPEGSSPGLAFDGRSAVHADRTTLGFALGMICARMNYSTPTVVYGYAHECGMRARARPPAAEPPSALSRPSDPLPHGPRAEQHR